MVVTRENGHRTEPAPPPFDFPPLHLPLQERITEVRAQFAIKSDPAVYLSPTITTEIWQTVGAGEWRYHTNPDGLLPWYEGDVNTFDARLLKALGTEQPKFQLPEEGHDEVHARAIHFEEENWDMLVRKAYRVDPGGQARLPRVTELKFRNGQRADVVGLGPDGRIFVDDVSCSQSQHNRYDKIKKIKNGYVEQIREVYKLLFGKHIDPELIVPRVIHFDRFIIPTTNSLTVYTLKDFESYELSEAEEQIAQVA